MVEKSHDITLIIKTMYSMGFPSLQYRTSYTDPKIKIKIKKINKK